MKFAIQTTFLPRENILFLHEWLEYHTRLGCEQFYLYDNSGSPDGYEGHNGFNRNGINVAELTNNLTDDDVTSILNSLVSDYPIKLIKWGDRYHQAAAASMALDEFGFGGRCPPRHRWMAFIDIDEFIVGDFSAIENEFAIMFRQRKFPCRWQSRHRPVTEQVMQMDVYPSATWAPKWMLACGRIHGDFANIHHPPVFPACPSVDAYVNKSDFFIHHYNTNVQVLQWWRDNWRAHDPGYKGSFDEATAFTVRNDKLLPFAKDFGKSKGL